MPKRKRSRKVKSAQSSIVKVDEVSSSESEGEVEDLDFLHGCLAEGRANFFAKMKL